MDSVQGPPSAGEVRRFGFSMLVGFAGMGALLWWAGRAPDHAWGWSGSARQACSVACWVAGVLFAAVCGASLLAGRRLHAAWMAVAGALGSVMTAVLLTLLYFLFLPFFAWIRLRDPLRARLRRDGSYWEDPSPHEATLERMRKPF